MNSKPKSLIIFIPIIIMLVFVTPLAIGLESYSDNPETSDYGAFNEVELKDYQAEESTAGVDVLQSYEVAPDEPENRYDEQLLEMQKQIDQLQSEILELQFNINSLSIVLSDDQAANNFSERQIAQMRLSERLMFQVEYYNAIALRLNGELLEHNIVLAQRQLEVERVRLSLGETAQSSVDIAEARFMAFAEQRRLSEEAFSAMVQAINRRSGLTGYEFISGFEIPTPATPNARTMESLISGLLSNNISLYSTNRQITRDNEFLSDLIAAGDDPEMIEFIRGEIRRLEVEREFLKSQLELTATNKWFSFLDTQAQHNLAEATRPLLMARLKLIDVLYDLGEISTVGKLTQRLEVYEELLNADMTAVALAIAVTELNSMMEGVVS